MKSRQLFFMVIFAAITLATAQQLRVDSVVVDTVWNSDSSWYNNQGISQQRTSRDLYLSFKPMPAGGGMAQCFVAISNDSAKAWIPAYDSLSRWDSLVVLDSGIASLVQCGTVNRVKLRVLGPDRPGIAFKISAHQGKPVIAGNPKIVALGLFTALTPGAACNVNLQCSLNIASMRLGYSTIAEVWWDAFATPGSWSDSTATGSYTWQTTVPAGAAGQRRAMIAKVRDANGLWSAPCTLTVQFGLVKPFTMVSIPAGTFQMGETDISILPVHSVTLGAFTMSPTLVTQEQYLAIMDTNPSHFDSGGTRPVDMVNWYDAALFCNRLSKLAGLDTVYTYSGIYKAAYDTLTSVSIDYTRGGYRLPTEAEYEYANRAGTTTDYYWGRNYPTATNADTLALDSNAVWYYNSQKSTQPVAGKKPNVWGLYDMTGNLREWRNDYDSSYSAASQTNPTGPATGNGRISRGGSWEDGSSNLCAGYRSDNFIFAPENNCGFRIVCGAR